MRFRITLTLADGNSQDLVWRLNDSPWTLSWADLTKKALIAGHHPAGMQVVVNRTEGELARLRDELFAVAKEAAEQGLLPRHLLEADLAEQDALNALHAALHLNEHAVPPAMNRLNILVHMIESGMRPQRGGYLVSYLVGDNLLRVPVPPEWLIEGDQPPKFGDLQLGYGTVGKRLVDCFYDDDEVALRRGLIRQQMTMCPEILVELREPYVRDGKREAFAAWCERVGAEKAGYPWKGTAHGTMHCPGLGKLISPIGLTALQARDLLARTVAVAGFAFL